MKVLAAFAPLLMMPVFMNGADAPSAVTYVGQDKVNAALAGRATLLDAPDLTISGARRTMAGEPEIHEKTTHVWYILDGSATVVTGGTMVGARKGRPGLTLGSNIEGGKIQRLSKGDMIVIRAGTPHWWKEVPQSITIYSVSTQMP